MSSRTGSIGSSIHSSTKTSRRGVGREKRPERVAKHYAVET